MALSRNKVIIALIPFFATTIGVGIFLIFFNYGDITLAGEHPFKITHNGQPQEDNNGQITFRVTANSEQNFLIQKPGYDDQTLTKTIAIWAKESVPLTFSYTPTITTTTFAKSITYPSRSDITDNQASDLTTSEVPATDIEIPTNFTKVVWAKDASSACLFNPQDLSVTPRLWENQAEKITLNKLPESTFECFSTDQGLLSVQIQTGKLLINGQAVPLTLGDNFYVTASPSGKFVLMSTFQSGTGSGSSLVTVFDREKNTTQDLTITNLKEYPRFIGSNTFAIHAENSIKIFSPGKETQDLNKDIDLRTLVYSEETNALYYPDSITIANQAKLENLFTVFQPAQKARGIIAYNITTKTERLIFTFPDIEQTVLLGKIYPDQKRLIFLTGEQGTTKLQITIAP